MRSILLASTACTSLVGSAVTAHASDFAGGNVWLGIDYVSGFSEMTIVDSDGIVSSLSMGEKSEGFILGADYGFGFGSYNDVVILVGASFRSKSSLGELSVDDLSFSFDVDPSYTIHIAPGIKINESTLAYAKLAISEVEIEGSVKLAGATEFTALKKNERSNSLGFGIRSFYNDEMFINLEIMNEEYNYSGLDDASFDFPMTRATLSFGINF